MNVKPLGERVLIEVKTTEAKTSGGLVIPQVAQEKTQEGVIVAIGELKDIKVKKGDRVIYDKYAGAQIVINEKDHLILKAEDILGIVE